MNIFARPKKIGRVKKVAALALTAVIAAANINYAAAVTDDYILTDPIKNTYSAKKDGEALISTLNFTDVPLDYWGVNLL